MEVLLKCSECGREFIRKCGNAHCKRNKHFFCSRKCYYKFRSNLKFYLSQTTEDEIKEFYKKHNNDISYFAGLFGKENHAEIYGHLIGRIASLTVKLRGETDKEIKNYLYAAARGKRCDIEYKRKKEKFKMLQINENII